MTCEGIWYQNQNGQNLTFCDQMIAFLLESGSTAKAAKVILVLEFSLETVSNGFVRDCG